MKKNGWFVCYVLINIIDDLVNVDYVNIVVMIFNF